jgi:transposase
MSKGSGTTRGDRRRNARRERLRGLLPRGGVVIGIDLAEDKQALAVIDHDVRVLARKTVRVKAFRLGEALDWAVGQARAKGFAAVTVACEPTGPRWMQVQRLCGERGLPLVCIQPLVSHIAREQQDYTTHKTDESDCVMIARLAVELHCYIPEELDEAWAHLRHLGRRRAQLITAATASVQRIRDFLSVAWPTVMETCAQPLESRTWLAALQLVTSRCGGRPEKLAAMGPEAFTALVRGAVAGWGGKKVRKTISAQVFAALADTGGVVAWSRRGLLRRVADELGDLQRTRARLRAVEADMVTVLDELGLSRLADIPALSAVGAAAILAETGDPRRYDGSSSLVKHAGLSPSDNASGAFLGDAHISRRGRPGLRLTVWRAVWPMLQYNPVMAAKYQAMTRATDAAATDAAAADAGPQRGTAARGAARARRAKARVACAASLLRWIYCMVVHETSWDPGVASGAAGRHDAPQVQAEAA